MAEPFFHDLRVNASASSSVAKVVEEVLEIIPDAKMKCSLFF